MDLARKISSMVKRSLPTPGLTLSRNLPLIPSKSLNQSNWELRLFGFQRSHPAHGIASGSLPPRNSFLLSFASLFADISTEMLYPILPILLTHTRSVVGLIEGIAGATQNIVQGIFAWGVNWR